MQRVRVAFFALMMAAIHADTSAVGFAIALGDLGGGSDAYGINDRGQVVGVIGDGQGGGRAALWTDGKIVDLGVLGTGLQSYAQRINAAGQVVGSSTTNAYSGETAFIWQNGVMTSLGTLGGGWSRAEDINVHAQVVGTSTNAQGFNRAFIWQEGIMRDLGALPGDDASEAYGINASGDIVGVSRRSNGTQAQAVLWQAGSIVRLESLPDWAFSEGRAINARGEIVLRTSSFVTGETRAYLWNKGTLRELGSLGGNYAEAWAINDGGRIVGGTLNEDRTKSFGFVWWRGVMLPACSPHLDEANNINERGQIVGRGPGANGYSQAVLCTP